MYAQLVLLIRFCYSKRAYKIAGILYFWYLYMGFCNLEIKKTDVSELRVGQAWPDFSGVPVWAKDIWCSENNPCIPH